MKVMIPINEIEGGKKTVANGFHNARFVCVYDCEKKVYEQISANKINENPGEFSSVIKSMGIDTVISTYIPPMALRVFTSSGLVLFRARGTDLNENINYFKNEQLELFTTEASRQLWACESGCSSCSSKSCA